jgi:hypothetical protein
VQVVWSADHKVLHLVDGVDPHGCSQRPRHSQVADHLTAASALLERVADASQDCSSCCLGIDRIGLTPSASLLPARSRTSTT